MTGERVLPGPDDEICGDRGPRVGENVLVCVLAVEHFGDHEPHPSHRERGWPNLRDPVRQGHDRLMALTRTQRWVVADDPGRPIGERIAAAVADYRASFPEPYALAPTLELAVLALAERDELARLLAQRDEQLAAEVNR